MATFRCNPTILFVLLITGVGSLIHIYSIGYMEHDGRRRRFFGHLNLFIAAMTMLRSIAISRATASAICQSSSLLALTAIAHSPSLDSFGGR